MSGGFKSEVLVIEPNAEPPTPEFMAKLRAWIKQSKEGKEQRQRFAALLRLYYPRLFDFEKVIERPVSRWSVNGIPICTAGNLTAISAQAKGGKSAVIDAMIAAVLAAGDGTEDRDTLGITASPPDGKALIHFDTEQSSYDAGALVHRSMKRAGVDSLPAWVWSVSLSGVGPAEIRALLPATLWEAGRQGGVAGVLIDGVADMVLDVNDAAESNSLVTELHNLAIQYDCAIVGVIHENPGSENGKARGHLGSQFERKAESNLRLQKSGDVTVIYSEKQRGQPILKSTGPRFQWSNEAGMHVSVQSAGDARDDAKREKSRDLAEAVFLHKDAKLLGYADLVRAIGETRKISASTAEDRFTQMKKLGVIVKCPLTSKWTLNPVTP